MVEGRLDHAALPAPRISIGREEALPRDERQGPVLDRRLPVASGLLDENAANRLRIIDEVARRPRDRELDDITVLAPDPGKVPERVAADRAEGLEHVGPRRAGCRRRRAHERAEVT